MKWFRVGVSNLLIHNTERWFDSIVLVPCPPCEGGMNMCRLRFWSDHPNTLGRPDVHETASGLRFGIISRFQSPQDGLDFPEYSSTFSFCSK